MHSTVRFADSELLRQPPPLPHHNQQDAEASNRGATVVFRLPKISASPDCPGAEASGPPAVYSRHGYSPPRSPQDTSGHWKYPLPSKSFRLYVGPLLRQTVEQQPSAAVPAASQSLSRGRGAAEADASPGWLQRSRTEPSLPTSQRQQQLQQLPAPYLPSRAQIFLRRRPESQPPGPPPPFTREGTVATAGPDEAERLRWTMRTQRHWQVDRKGQQRNQGPFSREFTVHVTAPSNWMRMKWGRRQPQLDCRPGGGDQQQQPVSYMYTKQAFGQGQPHHGY